MNDSNRKQTFPCTDMGNMERFLQHHQESIRFAGHKSSWLEWTGTHWKKVRADRIFTLALETIATIGTEADKANSPGDKRKLPDDVLECLGINCPRVTENRAVIGEKRP